MLTLLTRARLICAFMLGAMMLLPLSNDEARAQNTFGTLEDNGATIGYTLFHNFRGTGVYLIDNEGRLVNKWIDPNGYSQGGSSYLTKDGTLVRALNNGVDPDCAPGGDTCKNNPTFGAGGGVGGLIREYNWHGKVIWEFEYNNVDVVTHHDFLKLANGRILTIAYEKITKEDCVAAGLPNTHVSVIGGDVPPAGTTRCNTVTSSEDNVVTGVNEWIVTEHLIEVKPNYQKWDKSTITWEWHLFDHLLKQAHLDAGLTAADHPELWDPRNGWANFNSLDYHPNYNQILIGCNACNEIFVIEKTGSTKTARMHEGSRYGKGGDFLYRWGNPANYGINEPQQSFFQHGVRFIKRVDEYGWELGKSKEGGVAANRVGNILLFNNQINNLGSGPNSAITEIVPPRTSKGGFMLDGPSYGPAAPDAQIDTYNSAPEERFFSPFLSNGQRLPFGHTLIDVGASGTIIELDATNTSVWRYRIPAFTTNPGRTAGGPKPDDECFALDETPPPNLNTFAPGAPTTWTFRADKYSVEFQGFKGQDLTPGPVLCDAEIVAAN